MSNPQGPAKADRCKPDGDCRETGVGAHGYYLISGAIWGHEPVRGTAIKELYAFIKYFI